MFKSNRNAPSRLTASASVALLGSAMMGIVLIGGGCADVVTYGKDSRKQGLRLVEQRQYADAAGAFRNAVRQNPMDYRSYCYLGESYLQLGQEQQAIAAFRSGLDVQRQTYEGRNDVEMRNRTMNGLANAIASSNTADVETNAAEQRARGRNDPDDYLQLAKIHAARGDADNAIDSYNRAAVLAPDQFHIVKEYGLYLMNVGQTRRAASPLKRAYTLNEQDAQVNAALGKLGIVPGPSLRPQDDLEQPVFPTGPLPDAKTTVGGRMPGEY